MAANYLHGVETIELKKGPVPVSVVKSAVIGLVGIAPKGPVNTLTLVQNEQDAKQFGEQLPGYNIPKALADIFKQGAGTVLVINTFSYADNSSPVTSELLSVNDKGIAKTAYAPIFGYSSSFVMTNTNASAVIDASKYTVDVFGNVTLTDPDTIAEFAGSSNVLSVAYKRFNESSVNAAQLIGTYNSETDARTGMNLWDLAANTFGFKPRVLIAPGYSELAAVASELGVYADKFRGHALVDAPLNTSVSEAIAGRGPVSPIGGFNTSSKRVVCCYPHVKAYDIATNDYENRPLSQFMAGVIAATDNNEGYWVSPSNHEIKGIFGTERPITWALNDPQTDANALNEAGIVTVVSGFGTGIRLWGNRAASFPTSTTPDNFICVQRTADIVHESLEGAMLNFIDKPINQGTIDSVRETGNAFLRTLVQRGAVVDGAVTYNPAKNPSTELSAGHVTFDLTFMPPTPAERITFESFIDASLLSTIK